MAVIYIHNRPHEVAEGKSLLDTCLSLGYDIPYFCWHPAFGSVGACRQCAVKKYSGESDTTGRIVMSCMEPVVDGLRISIDDPDVKRFRASVIEWLMTNHPHDCPVCDEGGECHLQDMTVMTGHDYRRFRFNKRTHVNQYLGPFINHEMNRCIQCYRCVRFYRDYAGGRDFEVFSAHNHVYFGRHAEGILESEFSGNLVEICPTGVFTDKTFKSHFTRKWDLQSAPSLCVHCGLGCNIIAGERYGTVRRILNRYNSTVNGYFLCDRGRFGYEFVNSGKRLLRAAMRSGTSGSPEPVDARVALDEAVTIMRGGGVIGIGSPRASVESNYTLKKLVGGENFYAGLSDADHRIASAALRIMKSDCARFPSLRETEKADAVLVLGEDVTNTAPLLALSLRQSAKNRAAAVLAKNNLPRWNNRPLCHMAEQEPGPICVVSPFPTRLDDLSSLVHRAAPSRIALVGAAVARAISGGQAQVPGLTEEEKALAERVSRILQDASEPLVVTGYGCMSVPVIEAAAEITRALGGAARRAGLFITVPECNTMGLAMLGGKPLAEAFDRAGKGRVEAAVILENDLYRRASTGGVEAFLGQCGRLLVIDSMENETSLKSKILLPAAVFTEGDGTLVNNEGRAQRHYRVMEPRGDCRSGWQWLSGIMNRIRPGAPEMREGIDGIMEALTMEEPVFSRMKDAAPRAGLRIIGQGIPRQPHRYSGRTSMNARINIHEQKPPADLDSPLSFSMEGYRGMAPPQLVPFFWAPRWNSVQSVNKFQSEIGGPLRGGDPGVRLLAPGTEPCNPFAPVHDAAVIVKDEIWIVPYWRVFGSEELSAYSPPITGLIPEEALMLNRKDAERAGIAGGDPVRLITRDFDRILAVTLRDDIPEGTAGYPSGLPGCAFADLPARGRIMGAR